jgi:hypothetical protein
MLLGIGGTDETGVCSRSHQAGFRFFTDIHGSCHASGSSSVGFVERMITKRNGAERQLFTLRVWVEEVGDARLEIRGTLKHVLSGETDNFRGWPALAQQIEKYFENEKSKRSGEKS